MAPLESAYPGTRKRPVVLSLTRGAPTASCLLLAGRSPGPAARSDAHWIGPLGQTLQPLHRSWTSVLKRDGSRGDEDHIAADAGPVALPGALHPRGSAHGDALVDREPLE